MDSHKGFNQGLQLNEQQNKAVMHGEGPALVLAGPGSGKTTVITARVARLIGEMGVKPSQILTVTYNKAAQLEMQNRFYKAYQSMIPDKLRFSTLHSFCYRVLRDYEHQRGQRFTLIEGVNEDAFSKSAILRSLYKEINGSSLNDDELETLTNEIGLVKNKMLKEKDFKTEDLQTHNFPLIYKAYEEFKKSRALIDFDDMLTHALTILRRYPDILAWYQTKYTYFQVDEAQDLSRIQFEILKMLAGRSRNIFLVADDDQSIYGFRGAESRHILNIRGIYPDCTVYYLENNYRSSRDIVALTSSFIRHNENRFDKNHFTQNGPGPAPYIYAFEDVADQNSFVVKRIKALLAENPNMSIAVLFRTNLSSIALLDAFDRAGVLLSLRQNKVYFNRHWLVQDILAFLRLSLDPSDKESLLRIYYKMNRFISKSMVEAAVLQGDCNLLETIGREEGSNPAHQKKLAGLKAEFKRLSRMKPLTALNYIEDEFKYFAHVKEFCDTNGLSFNYLYGLFDIMRTLARHQSTISDFLARMDALEALLEAPDLFKKGSNVVLSTLHASKGLEFDAVFMTDLTNDEIPGQRAISMSTRQNQRDLFEEERRLFYVGMTRAKSELYLLSPNMRNGMLQARSTFINEVSGILNQNRLEHLQPGVTLQHKKYGKGIISGIESSKPDAVILQVDFNGRIRSLDFNTCMENGIISFPSVAE